MDKSTRYFSRCWRMDLEPNVEMARATSALGFAGAEQGDEILEDLNWAGEGRTNTVKPDLLCNAINKRIRRKLEDALATERTAGPTKDEQARYMKSFIAGIDASAEPAAPRLTAKNVQDATEASCVHGSLVSCYACMANWLNAILDSKAQLVQESRP